jgi:hypothetical protein
MRGLDPPIQRFAGFCDEAVDRRVKPGMTREAQSDWCEEREPQRPTPLTPTLSLKGRGRTSTAVREPMFS